MNRKQNSQASKRIEALFYQIEEWESLHWRHVALEEILALYNYHIFYFHACSSSLFVLTIYYYITVSEQMQTDVDGDYALLLE